MYALLIAVVSLVTAVSAQSLFDFATKQNVEPKRGEFFESHRGNAINHKNSNAKKEIPPERVSAGDIWDDEQMRELLGLEEAAQDVHDDDFNNEEGTTDGIQGSNDDFTEIPSLLSALYNKISAGKSSSLVPLKCRLPGMKGNVVRMLNNKGNVLYQDQRVTVVGLQFSFKYAFHQYENITQAQLQFLTPTSVVDNDELGSWLVNNGLMSPTQYKYQIYMMTDEKWKILKTKSTKWKLEQQKGTEDLLNVLKNLGNPVVTEYFSPEINSVLRTNKKRTINVKFLVQKWKKMFFKLRRRFFCRAVLVVTLETPSVMANRCVSPLMSNPKLLLVSLDKRQCPLPVGSYLRENDVMHNNDYDVTNLERRKRDLESSENQGISLEGKDNNNMRNGRTPDLIHGKSIRQSNSRPKRSLICKRHPMYVSFADVGWGQWIIAPRGYHAHRCAGECPFPLSGRLNGTNHAVLLTMMHSVESWNNPLPCCVPTVLTSISLLYFDTSQNVVLRQYEDMVVHACGCR